MRNRTISMLKLALAGAVLLLLLFSGAIPSGARAIEPANNYNLRFSENDPLLASVTARIAVKNGRIFMAPWGADFLPAGWATFVRNLQVTDESGRQLNIEPKPNGVWQISGESQDRVELSYQIDFSFTKSKWAYGNEQAGTFQNNALFVVSKALFIVSDAAERCKVAFEIPPSWKISTPWESSPSKPHTFLVPDTNNLINNSIVIGKHVEYTFRRGNFTFVLALLGSMEASRHLVSGTLQKVMETYSRIFTRTPTSKYMMTVFYAAAADAEAFSNSAAFSERDALATENIIRWGNTLAHEFFHSWNGHAIRGENYADSQWFAEGFTEYFANLALVQQGLITNGLFISKMEHNLGLYLYFKSAPAFDGVSLKQAGTRKGFYRLGVYNGGWAVAFCLDVHIRTATNRRKSLEDFMRLMYEKFALTGKAYRYEDLVSTANETVGGDISHLFKKYVEGDETLPVQHYLNEAGFGSATQFYDGEIYIFRSSNAPPRAREIRQGLLRGHSNPRAGVRRSRQQ